MFMVMESEIYRFITQEVAQSCVCCCLLAKFLEVKDLCEKVVKYVVLFATILFFSS